MNGSARGLVDIRDFAEDEESLRDFGIGGRNEPSDLRCLGRPRRLMQRPGKAQSSYDGDSSKLSHALHLADHAN